jgi:hypothetical protein
MFRQFCQRAHSQSNCYRQLGARRRLRGSASPLHSELLELRCGPSAVELAEHHIVGCLGCHHEMSAAADFDRDGDLSGRLWNGRHLVALPPVARHAL